MFGNNVELFTHTHTHTQQLNRACVYYVKSFYHTNFTHLFFYSILIAFVSVDDFIWSFFQGRTAFFMSLGGVKSVYKPIKKL